MDNELIEDIFTRQNIERIDTLFKESYSYTLLKFELSELNRQNMISELKESCKSLLEKEESNSPLDIGFSFLYGKSNYFIRLNAVNKDYVSGNCHCFPGVLQLYSLDDKLMFLHNVKPRKNSHEGKENKGIRKSNMPIIDKSDFAHHLFEWLNKETLNNQLFFDIPSKVDHRILADVKSICDEFIRNNNLSGFKMYTNYKHQCKLFFTYQNKEKNIILSPFTYNKKGIYK